MASATGVAAMKPGPGYSMAPLVIITALCNIAFMAFNTVVGPIARVTGLHEWQIGVVVSVAGLSWMLSSRPWGRMADTRGRLPVLRWGLWGFTVIFAILALAVGITLAGFTGAWFLFGVMLVTRALLGVSYSAVPVAGQALVADAFSPEQRAGALAALGAGGALGMVFGPALAAMLATVHLLAPMLATVVLGALALVLSSRLPIPARTAGESNEAMMGWLDRRLRWPSIVAFCAMFCVMSAQVNTAFYLMDALQVPASQATGQTGIVLTAVGVALIAAQMLVRFNAKSSRPWSASRLIMVGAMIGATSFALGTAATLLWQLAITYALAGFGMGMVFPAFAALASNAVSPHEQGVAMGTVGAAQASGMVIAPIASTTLYHIEPALPFWVASSVLALLAVAAWIKQRR
jgi:MFS family permease